MEACVVCTFAIQVVLCITAGSMFLWYAAMQALRSMHSYSGLLIQGSNVQMQCRRPGKQLSRGLQSWPCRWTNSLSRLWNQPLMHSACSTLQFRMLPQTQRLRRSDHSSVITQHLGPNTLSFAILDSGDDMPSGMLPSNKSWTA